MSFTPGPWHYEESEGEDRRWKVVQDDPAEGWIIAAIFTDVPELVSQGEANALLIAAAPELYKACKDLLLVFCATLSSFHVPADLYQKELNQANSALDKAEGK